MAPPNTAFTGSAMWELVKEDFLEGVEVEDEVLEVEELEDEELEDEELEDDELGEELDLRIKTLLLTL